LIDVQVPESPGNLKESIFLFFLLEMCSEFILTSHQVDSVSEVFGMSFFRCDA
jgi:hypothetical protein